MNQESYNDKLANVLVVLELAMSYSIKAEKAIADYVAGGSLPIKLHHVQYIQPLATSYIADAIGLLWDMRDDNSDSES